MLLSALMVVECLIIFINAFYIRVFELLILFNLNQNYFKKIKSILKNIIIILNNYFKNDYYNCCYCSSHDYYIVIAINYFKIILIKFVKIFFI